MSHPGTTVTSARIRDKDACHRARNLCVVSRVQKGTPGLTHKGYVLQRVSLGELSDVKVVLGMRQSIALACFYSMQYSTASIFSSSEVGREENGALVILVHILVNAVCIHIRSRFFSQIGCKPMYIE